MYNNIVHVGLDKWTGDTITVEKYNSHCNVAIIRNCLTCKSSLTCNSHPSCLYCNLYYNSIPGLIHFCKNMTQYDDITILPP